MHHGAQQLVRHPGSVRPDEQNSMAEYIHLSLKTNKVSKLYHLDLVNNCVLPYTMLHV